MIPHIPTKIQRKTVIGRPFNNITCDIPEDEILQKMQVLSDCFDFVQHYVYKITEATSEKKCLIIWTNGVVHVETAAKVMNAVASRNTRCLDPLFKFNLSWLKSENPEPEEIFDAAEHAIKALGLAEHQYIIVAHIAANITHCHVTINRIHPDTFKSQKIHWSVKTLHLAARESEIKHGWPHDNGIYVVKTDKNNQKRIVLIRKMPTVQRKVKPLLP